MEGGPPMDEGGWSGRLFGIPGLQLSEENEMHILSSSMEASLKIQILINF